MKIDIYTQKGKKKGTANIADAVFDVALNNTLIHQVVTAMRANARTLIAHTKDRSEVRGGGRKPWKQKGLGRARHGSSRSPIWIGGGVTFGPRNDRVFTQKINKKMRAKALFSVLSQKHKDGELLFLDSLSFDTIKTASAKEVVDALASIKGYEKISTKKKNTLLIAVPEKDLKIQKSFNNFGNVKIAEVRNINPVDTLNYTFVVIVNPEDSSKILESRLSVSAETVKTTKSQKTKTETKALTEVLVKKTTDKAIDDLTKIEGVGPVIAKTLNAEGIVTFADLASANTDKIQDMIKDVRGNHDAGTWGKQAELAMNDKWDELKKWQDELNGGK